MEREVVIIDKSGYSTHLYETTCRDRGDLEKKIRNEYRAYQYEITQVQGIFVVVIYYIRRLWG